MLNCADGCPVSAMMVRSSADNGSTWSAVRTVHDFTTVSGYAAPTVDHVHRAVVVFFNVEFDQTWMRRSVDDGVTWSDAINITSAVGPVALGNGIQLSSGRIALSPHADTNFALL